MDWYKDVTLLITHYNRTVSLERLLRSFQKLEISFAATVVADDGSNASQLQQLTALQQKYGFQLVTAEKNSGLAANINRGQKAAATRYILYVQEDFEANALFKKTLPEAMMAMERDKGLDLVRFFAHFRYPYLIPYTDEFEEVAIPSFATDYNKIYAYSDTPHLKRASFTDRFGLYREDLAADRMEYRMCVSFIVNKGRCLLSTDYAKLFTHTNISGEPSTTRRPPRQTSKALHIRIARFCYRQLRYNLDLLTTRRKS